MLFRSEISDEEALEEPEAVEAEPVAEPVVVERIVRINEGPSAEEIEAKLREGLEAKIRLEYEQRARETAEAEMLKLRREQEQLRMENERLLERARREEAQRQLPAGNPAAAMALGGLLSAIAQGRVAAGSINILAKKPDDWSKGLILCGIVEFYAILSLLATILLLMNAL